MSLALPSAADLVLDFLAAAEDGRMTAQDLCRGAVAMGFSEAVARVALSRLAQQNKILKVERGTYALHPENRALHEDVGNWLHRLTWLLPWKGNWIVVQDADVASQSKTVLRQHRRALTLRGFRALRPSFYLRPDNLRGSVRAMRDQLHALGLLETAVVFSARAFSDDQLTCIRQLWDVQDLRDKYLEMIGKIRASTRSLETMDDLKAARESLLLGRHIISEIVRDPLLPVEMMGSTERRTLIDHMRSYQSQSRIIWARVLNQPQPHLDHFNAGLLQNA